MGLDSLFKSGGGVPAGTEIDGSTAAAGGSGSIAGPLASVADFIQQGLTGTGVFNGDMGSLFLPGGFEGIFGKPSEMNIPEASQITPQILQQFSGLDDNLFKAALDAGIFTNAPQYANGPTQSLGRQGAVDYSNAPLINAMQNYFANQVPVARNQAFELGTAGSPGMSQANPFTETMWKGGPPLNKSMWFQDGHDSNYGHYEIGGRSARGIDIPKFIAETAPVSGTPAANQSHQLLGQVSPDVQDFINRLNQYAAQQNSAQPQMAQSPTNEILQQPQNVPQEQTVSQPAEQQTPAQVPSPIQDLFQTPQDIQVPPTEQPQPEQTGPIQTEPQIPQIPSLPQQAPNPVENPNVVPETPQFEPPQQAIPNISPLTDQPQNGVPAQEIQAPQEPQQPQQQTPQIPNISNLFQSPPEEASNLGGNQAPEQGPNLGQGTGPGLSDLFKPVQPSGDPFKFPQLPDQPQQQPLPDFSFADFPQQNFQSGSGSAGAASDSSAYGGNQMSPVVPGLSGQSTQSFGQQQGAGQNQQQQPEMQPMGMNDLWSNFMRF